MKFNKSLLIGLLLTTLNLNAQTDFRQGYIVKNTGDTLYGQIDYRGDILMSSICRYKHSDNTITEYSPNDIKCYRFIDSKFYVAKKVNNKYVFLEYLIKGIVNIYYMRDDKGDHYYLDKEGEKLTEIPYEEGIITVNNKKMIRESTMHIGFLNYYMQDAPNIQSQIQSIRRPNHRGLISLAEDYHNAVCSDEKCIVYEKKVPFIKISITPFLGLVNYLGYDNLVNEYGGYLYFWAPRFNEKIFFKTGFSHTKIPTKEKYIDAIKIPVQVQYIYRANRFQPQISSGVNLFEGFNTLCLNAGLNYQISDNLSITAVFNSDYYPMDLVLMNKEIKFDIVSYSIVAGIRLDL